jgi:sugar phosphate isomerase/epimerase
MKLDPARLLVQPEFDEREAWYALARERGFGLELVSLAMPRTLNNAEAAARHAEAYRAELAEWRAPLAMHGPFVDVVVHSSDRRIAEASRSRVTECLEAAAMIGASHVVFHTGMIFPRKPGTRWMRNAAVQGRFWRDTLERFPGVTVCLENMWEPGPEPLRAILDAAVHPRLKACFDVGHAHVFGGVAMEAWLEALGEDVVYVHVNDNEGEEDSELPLGRGGIDWPRFFAAVAALPAPPLTVIEVATLDEVRESIRFLESSGLL